MPFRIPKSFSKIQYHMTVVATTEQTYGIKNTERKNFLPFTPFAERSSAMPSPRKMQTTVAIM